MNHGDKKVDDPELLEVFKQALKEPKKGRKRKWARSNDADSE